MRTFLVREIKYKGTHRVGKFHRIVAKSELEAAQKLIGGKSFDEWTVLASGQARMMILSDQRLKRR